MIYQLLYTYLPVTILSNNIEPTKDFDKHTHKNTTKTTSEHIASQLNCKSNDNTKTNYTRNFNSKLIVAKYHFKLKNY
jgi:hypothetical protein